MIGRGMEAMILVHAVGDRVGEGILLSVERAGLDGFDRFREVHDLRIGAEQLEGSRLDLARQHANLHPLEIGGGADRPEAIRDVTEAVFEIAEDPIVHPGFDPGGQHLPEAPIHGDLRLPRVGER